MDPYVFREIVIGEAEVLAIIHVDDILIASKGAAATGQLAADLRSRCLIKDL